MCEMIVAKELHMTLGQLRQAMTIEELELWMAFRQLEAEEHQKVTRRVRPRR